MNDAVNFLKSLSESIFTGLDSVNAPVLGVSFLMVIITCLFINLLFWFLKVVSGGHQEEKTGGRLDDNNNYIYRR